MWCVDRIFWFFFWVILSWFLLFRLWIRVVWQFWIVILVLVDWQKVNVLTYEFIEMLVVSYHKDPDWWGCLSIIIELRFDKLLKRRRRHFWDINFLLSYLSFITRSHTLNFAIFRWDLWRPSSLCAIGPLSKLNFINLRWIVNDLEFNLPHKGKVSHVFLVRVTQDPLL